MTNTANTAAALPTRNEDWGFWGTIAQAGQIDVAAAWATASATIAAATTCEAEAVRAFLDSRHGRHFADSVSNFLHNGKDADAAIAAAAAEWMGWKIGRRTSRETGIPAGLPYLTGYVANEGINAEASW
ncbi:hypothetical protein ATO13_22501 [Stappia sp. 22II-S9-Z10]|nr:hypothetical protein ATO13_22501 [Stappia sp. 22II-S9-Z10]